MLIFAVPSRKLRVFGNRWIGPARGQLVVEREGEALTVENHFGQSLLDLSIWHDGRRYDAARLERGQSLERGALAPISAPAPLTPVPDNSRFAFLLEGTDPQAAREDLAEAVSLLVERPALEAAIVAATARFETDPEGAFAEQQRLRQRKLEIESRLGQMARKRAGSGAPQDQSSAADPLRAGEQETG